MPSSKLVHCSCHQAPQRSVSESNSVGGKYSTFHPISSTFSSFFGFLIVLFLTFFLLAVTDDFVVVSLVFSLSFKSSRIFLLANFSSSSCFLVFKSHFKRLTVVILLTFF